MHVLLQQKVLISSSTFGRHHVSLGIESRCGFNFYRNRSIRTIRLVAFFHQYTYDRDHSTFGPATCRKVYSSTSVMATLKESYEDTATLSSQARHTAT